MLGTVALKGQSSNSTLYFMDQHTQRMNFNASFTSGAGYVSMPGLGGISLGVASNVGPKTFLYHNGNELVTIFHPSAPYSALDKVKRNNRVDQSFDMTVIGFGFYVSQHRNMYVSFNSTLRENAYTSIPGDFVKFLKRGQHGDVTSFDFSNLRAGTSIVLENALGFSMDIDKNLRVGGRLKYLMGVGRMQVNYEKFDAVLSHDRWLVKGEGTMEGSFNDITYNTDSDGALDWDTLDLDVDKFKPAGNGVGIDLGATYKDFFIPGLTVALAINDLGMMSWDKSLRARAKGGLDFQGFDNIDQGLEDKWKDDLGDDLKQLIQFIPEKSSGSKSQWLETNMRLSGEYSIFQKDNRDLLSAGLSYYGLLNSPISYNEIMVAATYRPADWFSLSGNVAFPIGYRPSLGFTFMFSGAVNFYMAANVGGFRYTAGPSVPLNNITTNVQFGLNFRIAKRRIGTVLL